jgi:tRNA threonylcarbamoyladenosine biosynthesis protein TsaB
MKKNRAKVQVGLVTKKINLGSDFRPLCPKYSMATILQIETATEVCSIAVSVAGRLASLKEEPDCRQHIAYVTMLTEACLADAGIAIDQLDAVAVSAGPGAYTSLRTGVSTAKGLCYALDIPLISVDTLAALAAGAFELGGLPDEALCISMVDARRNEVWLSAYRSDLDALVPAQPLILDDGALEDWVRSLNLGEIEAMLLAGNGQDKINSSNFGNNTYIRTAKNSSARFLTQIAEKKYKNKEFELLATFEPFYMKPPNITQPAKINP